jgi:hypothetical protein
MIYETEFREVEAFPKRFANFGNESEKSPPRMQASNERADFERG